MTRTINLNDRRANLLDLDGILLGAVRASEGAPAGTRDGSARILNTKLNALNVFKVVLVPASSSASGGYLIEVAHVDRGDSSVSSDFELIGTIEADALREVAAVFDGVDIGEQARAAAHRRILTLGTRTAGSGYTGTGTYNNVPLTGGTGSGAQATIVVSGGGVSAVTLTKRGRGFTVGDALSASNANLGGAGSGFSIPVGTVGLVEEPRVTAIRLTPGNGSNGAAAPSNIGTVFLSPVI